MGIPDHMICLLRNLYAGQEATVRTGHETTDWFHIFPGGSLVKNAPANAGDTETWIQSLCQGDPLEEEMTLQCPRLENPRGQNP